MPFDDADAVQYINELELAPLTPERASAIATAATASVADEVAYVNRGCIIYIPIPPQQKTDALNWTLFAQLAADARYSREEEPIRWYQEYVAVLGRIGMRYDGWSRNSVRGSEAAATVDGCVTRYLKPYLSPGGRGKLDGVIGALKKSENRRALTIFNTTSSSESSANFQVSDGTVDSSLNLTIYTGFMDFKTNQNITNLLYWTWSNRNFTLYYAKDKFTLAKNLADRLRRDIERRLVNHIVDNIDSIELA